MNFWNEHGTKILGWLTTVLASLASLISIGAFNDLLEPGTVKWMAIIVSLLTGGSGAATINRGSVNTAQIKVATAIDNALKATPSQETK